MDQAPKQAKRSHAGTVVSGIIALFVGLWVLRKVLGVVHILIELGAVVAIVAALVWLANRWFDKRESR